MKAQSILARGEPSSVALRDVTSPVPSAGEVLVRVHAAALNPADLKVLRGKDGGGFLHAGAFPLVLGFDFSGVVEALGAGAVGFEVGQPVFGFLPYAMNNRQGSLGELVVVPTSAIAIKPASLSHAQAAALATAGCTALQALRDDGRLRAGGSVLVNGASGGVGSLAVQIARQLGAAEVWATCSAGKLAAVAALGADKVVDYKVTALGALGRRFDVVLDAASTSSATACADIMVRGGTYVTLLPSAGLLWGKLSGWFSQRRATFAMTKSRAADLAQLAAWQAAGAVIVPIAQTFAFEQTIEALTVLDAGTHVGKLVVRVAS
ncbi:MAG: NAD(P)-dependent alcohol dehydrogenase [Myxococcales bacterium]|nr:NAD(P)-dependent alcohol dehydrogenase [Myxococcales bacterium]